jgi:chromosome segregation ATPase
MIRRRALRHAYRLFALVLAATITRGQALADPDAPAPVPQDDEVLKLQAHRAELVEEIETLRSELARSEKVRRETRALLDSVSKRLRAELDAHQAPSAPESRRGEKELSSTRQALDAVEAEKAHQTERTAELEKTIADLRVMVTTQEAEHKKLESELAALEHARNDAAQSQARLIASHAQQTKRLATQIAEAAYERESRARELEAQQSLLATTRRELEALRAERDRAAVKVNGLERDVQVLRAATAEHAAANQRKQADLARRSRERDDQAKKNAEALARRNEQIAQLSRQLADAEREATERATRLETQAHDLAAARSELESLKAERRRQSDRGRALDAEVAMLRTGAAEQGATEQRLEREFSISTRKADDQAKQQAATIASHDTEVERLQRQLASIEGSRQERDAKIAAQEEELVSARAALETLQTAQRERSAGADRNPEVPKHGTEVETSRQPIGELAARTEALAADLSRDRAVRGAKTGDGQRPEDASQGRIGELEAELQQARDRELTSRAETKSLQKALETEKQASRSKLETLQSVLQNTRTAGAELRASLDEARQKNADLSRQVGNLNEAVRKVHALRTKYEEKELHAAEPNLAQSADQEVHEEQLDQTTSATAAAEPAVAKTLLVGETDPASADLREQLSVERERRETLEQEIQRLTASGNTEEKFVEVWKALQSARSEILVLSNQLTDERKNRENLEVTLERIQRESDGEARGNRDVARQLAETLNQRRAEADRLSEQLKNANEIIVRLKGRLEATESSAGENKVLGDLDKENKDLRDALKAAQEANTTLRAKAEMAERLAEMVYGKGP